MTGSPIVYDSMIIALGVVIPASLALSIKPIKKHMEAARTRKAEKIALEKRKDEILMRLATTVEDIRKNQNGMAENIRDLYPIQYAQLDSLEICILSIIGEGLNGNMETALGNVRAEKQKIVKLGFAKICADIGQAAD